MLRLWIITAMTAGLLAEVPHVDAQYKANTPLFKEKMTAAQEELSESLKGGDYVEEAFYPERQVLPAASTCANQATSPCDTIRCVYARLYPTLADAPTGKYGDTDVYVYAYPDSSDYTIGIIVDPCQGNAFDCCHRFYGSPEYAVSTEPDDSSFRAVKKFSFAGADDILANAIILDKDGVPVTPAHSRFADDEVVIDDACVAPGEPEDLSCVGFRQKMQRSASVARCSDNNQTVDASASCQDLSGQESEHCLAVGYSQTAISVVCGGDFVDDPHCGTFLEIHMGYDNSYVGTGEVISDVHIRTENVSGYTTTTMPTTWMNDSRRILCAYEHASLLVGTMVLIAEDAPACCCPRAFSQKDQLGSLVCPAYNSLEGPYAASPTTVAEKIAFEEQLDTYPFCPALDESEDLMVISEFDDTWKRFYTREAARMMWNNATSSYTSDDASGEYEAICDYLPQCGVQTKGSCSGDDRQFTFSGHVGKITFAPADPDEEQYGVTFNDGRTSYFFNQEHLRVEQDYNYEIWWVQRTPSNFRVQARKPMTVTNPTCAFDSTNGQYFPYAVLDADGDELD